MNTLRRWVACLAGLGVLLGLSVAPGPTATDAAWTDAEQVEATTMTVMRLVPPQIQSVTTCLHPLYGILSTVTVLAVTWKWPDTTAPNYNPSAATATWTVGGITSTTQDTTYNSNTQVYTTTFSKSVVGNLLTGLSSSVGGSYTVSASTTWSPVSGNTWTSPAASTVTVTYPALGLGTTTCTFTNGT
ncbi:MAG: hypothetical protein QM622_02360 [Microbacterium sp.]